MASSKRASSRRRRSFRVVFPEALRTPPITPVVVKSDLEFIHLSMPSLLLLNDGPDVANNIDPQTGEFPSMIVGDRLEVEAQRRADQVVSAGIIADDLDMISLGLLAFEVGLSYQGELGNFPTERNGTTARHSSFHAKTEFLYAAAKSLRVLRDYNHASFTSRVDAAIDALMLSAHWAASPSNEDCTGFFADAQNTNQLFFAAVFIHIAGKLGPDATLIARAAELMADIMARQTTHMIDPMLDGIFPEGNPPGFDSSYHTVSLDLFCDWCNDQTDIAIRSVAFDALRRGYARFRLCVNESTGVIDTGPNTRTDYDGDPVSPGVLEPKGRDIDIIPLRMYLGAYMLDDATYNDLGDAILRAGQAFSQ